MTTGKTIALTVQTSVSKVMSLFYNMLSRFTIPFLPSSKRLLISWLQLLSAVILAPKKTVCHCFCFPPIHLPWDGTRCHELSFRMLSFKPAFHSPLSPSSRGTLVPRFFLPLRRVICISDVIDISPGDLDPACVSSSQAFCMMYSACKLNDKMMIYSFDILLYQFRTCPLFYVQF